MQSGAGLGHFNARQDTLEHAQANGIRLFEALGVSTLEQARAIPARTVLEAAESLPVPPDSGREDDWSMIVNWAPCVDGLFLPDQEERIVEAARPTTSTCWSATRPMSSSLRLKMGSLCMSASSAISR